jgi:hypothetical protein
LRISFLLPGKLGRHNLSQRIIEIFTAIEHPSLILWKTFKRCGNSEMGHRGKRPASLTWYHFNGLDSMAHLITVLQFWTENSVSNYLLRQSPLNYTDNRLNAVNIDRTILRVTQRCPADEIVCPVTDLPALSNSLKTGG